MNVHRSQLAGTWYPGRAERLREVVDGFLAAAAAEPISDLAAVIVPHAGYSYSGRAAGAAYACFPKGVRRVVLLAPSHRHFYAGAAVHPGDGFETPLGVVAIDRERSNRLLGFDGFAADETPYHGEHSLEIQLPFLQRIDRELRVVPILVGANERGIHRLAPGLRMLAGPDAVFVVSSDFTHYGGAFDYLPFPPRGQAEVREQLRALDFGAIESICRLDGAAFESYVGRTGITVCGRAPIAAFLHASPTHLAGTVVSYYTSLDVTGDFEHSVSYAAIVFRPAGRSA